MSLELAIKLTQATTSLNAQISARLDRVGLSFTDFLRLQTIGTADKNLRDIATVMNESGSEALRATRPLEKLGWTKRSESGVFALTDSGRALVDQAEGLAEAAATRWFADRSIDPAEALAALGNE